ncbi:hypothetical protein V7148_06015 [Gottfriedia acidiceleris]|nr:MULTISPECIES: hypothetical protein [unclassified Bacillus (in: firmicutes)]
MKNFGIIFVFMGVIMMVLGGFEKILISLSFNGNGNGINDCY